MVPGSLACHAGKATFTAVTADGQVERVIVKLGEPEGWPRLSVADRSHILAWCATGRTGKRRMTAGGSENAPTAPLSVTGLRVRRGPSWPLSRAPRDAGRAAPLWTGPSGGVRFGARVKHCGDCGGGHDATKRLV